MLTVEVPGAIDPLFSFQAVNAAEDKLVAQPFAKLCGTGISLGTVLASVPLGGLAVCSHAAHRLDFFRWAAFCCKPISSNSKMSFRSGATCSA